MDGSDTSQRREKSECLGTRVRPEVKEQTKARAEKQGVTVAEYLRRLVRQGGETPKTA
jgi:predicted HicB family RNase H-like nuclease